MSRISFIAKLTKGYDTVIDIGSDHGLVLKYALDNNFIKHAIASDINEGPLNRARKNLAGYPVRFYLSDGLKQVDADFDLAVITGMGPYIIIDILKEALNLDDKVFILGSHERVEVLRLWLMQNGFNITDEYVIRDGFYYVFLKVQKGIMNLSESDIYVGPILKDKTSAHAYFVHKHAYYLKLSKKAKGDKLTEVKHILKHFSDVLKL